MRSVLAVSLTALVLCTGCVSGDFRRISLDTDMTPGDLAHYRKEAGSIGGEIESFYAGIPLAIAPVLHRTREAVADDIGEGVFHYHFEDDFGIALLVYQDRDTSNFDAEGKLVSYHNNKLFAAGVVSFASGRAPLEEGGLTRTHGFSILWGLFEYRRHANGKTWRLLWLPFGSDND